MRNVADVQASFPCRVMSRSLSSLFWLALGAFAIGTEGFMIAGLLPSLARDLNVSLPVTGQLITAFSFAYAIGAPIMAVLTATLERRRLLAVCYGRVQHGQPAGRSVSQLWRAVVGPAAACFVRR